MEVRKYYTKTDVYDISKCKFEQLGHKPKRIIFIPVKGKNGISKDKFLRLVENGPIYKQILGSGTKLPACWIVEE